MENTNKKELKSILIDKIIYDRFKSIVNENGFKVKEIVEILMKIYSEGKI